VVKNKIKSKNGKLSLLLSLKQNVFALFVHVIRSVCQLKGGDEC
jgi:hypothetical protein